MIVNIIILASNPFFDAYIQSDFLGKLIFIGLIALSVVSWAVLIHKVLMTVRARQYSLQFNKIFQLEKFNPLALECEDELSRKKSNPFLNLYLALKQHSFEILNKNRRFAQSEPEIGREEANVYLSVEDLHFIAAHLQTAAALQIKHLEKNLFILSTVVSLAPFLGLLGTVWGILTTFAALQSQSMGSSHQLVLSGLSLALATTVLGLVDAIPALIGYNYLKNTIRDFETEMQGFSTEILASVELRYRKVD